jgi:hypothetical protein
MRKPGNARMPQSSRIKGMLLVNALLLLTFLLLVSPLLTGLVVHEITGIMFLMLLLMHLLFSWNWIKKMGPRFKMAQWRIKLGYLVHWLLFLSISLQLASGLIISQFVLPYFGLPTINDWVWRELHQLAYQFSILLTCLHISLNLDRIKAYCREVISNKIRRYIPARARYIPVGVMLGRAAIIISVMFLIGLVAWMVLGKPIKDRLHPEDEIKHFQPMLIPGLVQFFGAFAVLAILTYMAKRWVKIRR